MDEDLQLCYQGVDNAMGEIPGSRLSDEKPAPDSGLNSGVSLSRVTSDLKSEATTDRCEEGRMTEVSRRCFSGSKGC